MSTLVTTDYTRPGAYLGQLITPQVTTITGNPRLPVYIGKGDRLAQVKNAAIRRSYIFEEQLTVPATAPHTATLNFPSNEDQTVSRLFDQNGTEVPKNNWQIDSGGLTITIDTQAFDATKTYFIDYQSTSRDPLDPIPFDDIRLIETMGRNQDQPDFTEFEDYFIDMAASTPAADSGNAFTDDQLGKGLNTTIGTEFATAVTGDVGSDNALLWTATTAGAAGNGVTITFVDSATHPPTLTETLGTKTIVVDFDSGTPTLASDVITAFGSSSVTLIQDVSNYLTSTGAGSVAVDEADTTSLGTAAQLEMAGGSNVSNHAVYLAATSDYTHPYDRVYHLEVITTGTGTGIDDAVIMWRSTPNSAGNATEPRNPVTTALDEDATLGNVVDFSTLPAGTKTIALEHGISVVFEDASVSPTLLTDGDAWTFDALSPGLMELDQRHSNTNQFVQFDVTPDAGNTGLATLDFSDDNTYTGTFDTNFKLVCSTASTGSGTTAATFQFAQYGEEFASSTFTVSASSPTAILGDGVEIEADFGLGDFAVGDEFIVEVDAGRVFITHKDDRNYTWSVTSAASDDLETFFSTDTLEGRFGTLDVETDQPQQIPGGIFLAFRNIEEPRYAAGDGFTFSVTNPDSIDWSLQEQVTETIDEDDIIHDVLGTVTGTPNTFYIILNDTPSSLAEILSVEDSLGTPLSFTWITDSPFIYFATNPADDITVIYRHDGEEPAPGDLYFLTGLFLRPSELYNTAILSTDVESARDLLAPNSTANHLYNMAEIAFENDPAGIYTIQVADGDGDGVFTDVDYREGIEASELTSGITDVVVLARIGVLGDALASVDAMNDPFERKERLLWVGMPVDTPIGTHTEVGSLVYTAKNTLAVFGNSPAHGTRILMGSTFGTRTIRLPDNTEQEVTFDGSFVAGAVAALISGFSDPGDTILRKTFRGFSDVQTYNESEDLRLGAAQILYVSDQGSGVFRLEEDTTVDAFAPDFAQINAMTQKQFVTRFVRQEIEDNFIGIIPTSAEAGAAALKSLVLRALSLLVSRGIIASYQDVDGNERLIDPGSDVVVFRDDTAESGGSPSLYHLRFAFWLRFPAKRVFGLFVVDTNDLGL